MDRILIQIELTVIAGDHESYKISRQDINILDDFMEVWMQDI